MGFDLHDNGFLFLFQFLKKIPNNNEMENEMNFNSYSYVPNALKFLAHDKYIYIYIQIFHMEEIVSFHMDI